MKNLLNQKKNNSNNTANGPYITHLKNLGLVPSAADKPKFVGFFGLLHRNIGGIETSKNPTSPLEKSTKRLSFINLVLLKLGAINFLILTYFYFQSDIIFRSTGWFSLSQSIHWYYIFVELIALRMIIVFITHQVGEYIKNSSLWNEKEKKNALNVLALINFLTIPINLPLIGTLFFYLNGREIFCNNWFLGTFQRILNENEREKLYQETVKNFLEKTEVSKEIKDQLKKWALENTESVLEKYDAGSAFATEYLSEKLEGKKEFLQLEEIKNSKITDVVDKSSEEQQGLLPWILDQTINGLNYFNPFVADYKTFFTAWGVLVVIVGAGIFILAIANTNTILLKDSIKMNKDLQTLEIITKNQANSINVLREALKDQKSQIDNRQIFTDVMLEANQIKIDGSRIDTDVMLKAQKLQIETYKIDTDVILKDHKNLITTLKNLLVLNGNQNNNTQKQLDALQRVCTTEFRIPLKVRPTTPFANNDFKFTTEKKNEFLKTFAQKYEKQELTMDSLKKILNDLFF